MTEVAAIWMTGDGLVSHWNWQEIMGGEFLLKLIDIHGG
jgi:hypothetical protein